MDVLVKNLRSKGVKFEHYDLPNTTLKDDIHIDGDMKVAWFKDPDSNILNIINKWSDTNILHPYNESLPLLWSMSV